LLVGLTGLSAERLADFLQLIPAGQFIAESSSRDTQLSGRFCFISATSLNARQNHESLDLLKRHILKSTGQFCRRSA
jgi:hypothetical protein